SVLFDPQRHEALRGGAWDEGVARAAIDRIVAGAHEGFVPGRGWPLHPLDRADPAPVPYFYFGDAGVAWALRHLERRGAAQLRRDYSYHLAALQIGREHASYLFGETAIRLLRDDDRVRLAALIDGNIDHPARELMWGSPGTMLAALFVHRRTGDALWSQLF